MSLWRKVRYVLLPSARRNEDRDIEEELESLRQFAEPNELGNLTLAAEDARAALGWLWIERLGQDARYALRSMTHRKAFTALILVSLALGIGANTAIYSFLDAVLLRRLPVRDPDALVVMKWRAKGYALASSGMMWSTDGSTSDAATGTTSSIFPYPALRLFEDSDVLDAAFCYFAGNRLALTANGETDSVKGQYVSGTYFSGIGVSPIAGHLIQPSDDAAGSASVAVLSERMGRRRFGSAGAALGQAVWIDNNPFTVIGVVPASFFGAEPGAIPDVYLPMRAAGMVMAARRADLYDDHHLYWIEIMGRLRPNVTVQQAQAALAARFRQYVEGTARTSSQREDLPTLTVVPGGTGLDSLRRKYAQAIYVLMSIVALILLIACSNVASLLLARAVARRREIAIRLSIGASRARVIRQLLTESLIVSLLAGSLGVLFGWWGIEVLTGLLSSGRDNFTLHAELNWTVLAVTSGLSVFTGLLFGLAPAIQATAVDVAPALKEVNGTDGPRRRYGFGVGQVLVIVQVVLSVSLLIGAALFGRTLANLHAIPAGFDREHVLLFSIRPSAVGYRASSLTRIFEQVRGEIARVPGVQDVGLSSAPLPMGGGTMTVVGIEGAEAPGKTANGRPPAAVVATVGPGFFRTLRIGLQGREFTERDDVQAGKVVIVNKRLAKTVGVENPLGRALTLQQDRYEIIGVVDDALSFTLKETLRPAAYFSYLQGSRPPGQMTYEIRTAASPMSLAPAMRQTIRRIDPRLAIYELKSQSTYMDQEISTQVTLARLCLAFAALALIIACVGVYGTVSFSVTRRTNEIGVRMTLGAGRGLILWMVLRQVVVMTAIGLAIGVPLALVGSQYVRSLLYQVAPTDPAAMMLGAGALLICSLLAGLVPAHRASRIDPLSAIRHE